MMPQKSSIIVFLFLLFSLHSFSVDFTYLSREKPVMISYRADKNSNIAFILNLKSLKEIRLDIFLKASYIIGGDTLNDFLYLDESYTGSIKEIYLEEGDSVYAYIWLNNDGTEKIENIKGSFISKTGAGIDMQSTGEMCKFTGTIWKDNQLPLFRISKTDDKNQLLSLDVSLTENFDFDKLYLKIKVVSPSQGILLYSKEFNVNEDAFLPYRRKLLKIDFPDLEVKKAGSYYVQVFHQMSQSRINGVEYLSYQLIDK